MPWLMRHARLLLAASVFIGVASPELAALLRPLLFPTIVALLTIALTFMDFSAIWAWRRRPGVVAALLGWQLLGAPLLFAGLFLAIGLPAVAALVLTLHAAAPPVTASPVLARMVGIDPSLVVVAVVLGTLLLPISLMMLGPWLFSAHVQFEFGALLRHCLIFIALPFAAAMIFKRAISLQLRVRHARRADALNLMLLVIFAIGIMDGVQAKLLAAPLEVTAWLLAACAMALVQHALGYLGFHRWGRELALAAAISTGNRNLGLMLAVTAGIAGEEFLLYVALGQLPIYFMPMLLAPLARRLMPVGRPPGAGA